MVGYAMNKGLKWGTRIDRCIKIGVRLYKERHDFV